MQFLHPYKLSLHRNYTYYNSFGMITKFYTMENTTSAYWISQGILMNLMWKLHIVSSFTMADW